MQYFWSVSLQNATDLDLPGPQVSGRLKVIDLIPQPVFVNNIPTWPITWLKGHRFISFSDRLSKSVDSSGPVVMLPCLLVVLWRALFSFLQFLSCKGNWCRPNVAVVESQYIVLEQCVCRPICNHVYYEACLISTNFSPVPLQRKVICLVEVSLPPPPPL